LHAASPQLALSLFEGGSLLGVVSSSLPLLPRAQAKKDSAATSHASAKVA
jgi:hypothetical protein